MFLTLGSDRILLHLGNWLLVGLRLDKAFLFVLLLLVLLLSGHQSLQRGLQWARQLCRHLTGLDIAHLSGLVHQLREGLFGSLRGELLRLEVGDDLVSVVRFVHRKHGQERLETDALEIGRVRGAFLRQNLENTLSKEKINEINSNHPT